MSSHEHGAPHPHDIVSQGLYGWTCPYCGMEYDQFSCEYEPFDMYGNQWEWMPCCYDLRDEVNYWGFEYVFGCTVEQAAMAWCGEYGLGSAREAYDDGLVRFPLCERHEGEVHDEPQSPGHPLRKCSSPEGWKSTVIDLINEHHRHLGGGRTSKRTPWKFGVAVYNGHTLVGVAVVEKPISRMTEQSAPATLEVTRLATFGDERLRRNASSKLYAACADKAREVGATRLITATLAEESGVSLEASGFVPVHRSAAGGWNHGVRARAARGETLDQPKIRWERGLTKNAKKAVRRAHKAFLAAQEAQEAAPVAPATFAPTTFEQPAHGQLRLI